MWAWRGDFFIYAQYSTCDLASRLAPRHSVTFRRLVSDSALAFRLNAEYQNKNKALLQVNLHSAYFHSATWLNSYVIIPSLHHM